MNTPVLEPKRLALEGVRWIFCLVDTEVVSARSEDGSTWSVQEVEEYRNAGDAIITVVADEKRAWVTNDTLYPGSNLQIWTEDGGTTWNEILYGHG